MEVTLICDLKSIQPAKWIKVRVCRKWNTMNAFKDYQLRSLDCILVDQQVFFRIFFIFFNIKQVNNLTIDNIIYAFYF